MKNNLVQRCVYGVMFLLLLSSVYACKKDEETLPAPTPQPAPNLLHNFWHYAGGSREILGNLYPLNNPPERFLYLSQDGLAVVALDNVAGSITSGCEVYQTTYREQNASIYLRYNPCAEFSDSLFYIKYLSADSLALRTRGYWDSNPQIMDSIYGELYFRKAQ